MRSARRMSKSPRKSRRNSPRKSRRRSPPKLFTLRNKIVSRMYKSGQISKYVPRKGTSDYNKIQKAYKQEAYDMGLM